MAIVRTKVYGPESFTEEDIAESIALKDRPIDYSDIPKSTQWELAEIRRQVAANRRKLMFSLRLQNSTIKWWKKSIGEGYTSVMARLLDEATRHPEWIKACFQ